MKTMTEIAADIAANLAANMADIQQRMGQLDAVLDDLRAAGVELEIKPGRACICNYDAGTPYGSVTLQTTNNQPASTVRTICEKHGGDWFEPEKSVLSTMYGINVHIYGLDHSK